MTAAELLTLPCLNLPDGRRIASVTVPDLLLGAESARLVGLHRTQSVSLRRGNVERAVPTDTGGPAGRCRGGSRPRLRRGVRRPTGEGRRGPVRSRPARAWLTAGLYPVGVTRLERPPPLGQSGPRIVGPTGRPVHGDTSHGPALRAPDGVARLGTGALICMAACRALRQRMQWQHGPIIEEHPSFFACYALKIFTFRHRVRVEITGMRGVFAELPQIWRETRGPRFARTGGRRTAGGGRYRPVLINRSN